MFCVPCFAGDLAQTLPGTNLAALEAIEKSGLFRVQVFTREIDGHQEAIVLLGETHMKNGEASRLGRDFLNGFHGDIGVEGVDWDRLFLGQALRSVIYAMHETVGMIAFGSDRQPSTILDAITLPNPEHDPHRRVLRLEKGHDADWVEKSSLWLFTAVLARTLAEGGVRLGLLVVKTAKGITWVVNHPDQLDWRKYWTRNPDQPKVTAQQRANALFDWMLAAPRRLLTAALKTPARCGESLLQFLALSPNDPTRNYPLWKRLAVKGDEGLRYAFLGMIGGNVYLHFHPDIPLGLLNGRNHEMVRNAVNHLDAQLPPPDSDEDEPNPRPLMVVEGMGHLPGWGHLLGKHGFQRVY